MVKWECYRYGAVQSGVVNVKCNRCESHFIVIILHLRLLPPPSLGQSLLTIPVPRPGVDWHGRRTQQQLSTEVSLPIIYWLATY